MSNTPIKNIKFNPIAGKSKQARDRWVSQPATSKSYQTGIAGDDFYETRPVFNKVTCETVLEGKNDSYIVLGRDRYGNELQGKGMTGEAKCSMIDIVVGRLGGQAPEVNEDGEMLIVNPNFELDSARIYISQRTDVDKNFNIAAGKVGNFENRSAIAMKADGIRLLSREGIKLVTRIDPTNSMTLETGKNGIDLIALNDDSDLQPIPKGDNLNLALQRLVHHVRDLNLIVKAYLLFQMKFNKVVQEHVHISPFWGENTFHSLELNDPMEGAVPVLKDLTEKVGQSLDNNMKNLLAFQSTYLEKTGSKYINSEYNNTN
tara:strand:- start:957 stop:1907 length:951 start_codon:yes stop_codon:yes gene_type:complete